MRKQKIYWLCQIVGWSLYGLLQIVLYSIAQTADLSHIIGELIFVGVYLVSTHFIRFTLIHFGWFSLDLSKLIPRILLVILGLSFVNYMALIGYTSFTGELATKDFMLIPVVLNFFGPMFIYTIWTVLYLSFHYFENYNKSLKYEAAAHEIELRNLKAQLNPHFIFNALNSIRALIDEDPLKSKNAITQLSSILRNSLMSDRQKLIPFDDEFKTIKDYLALESIRYEERLSTHFDIDPLSIEYMIPPLMVQTLVENGIKHGISTLKTGGEISIVCRVENEKLHIEIRNSGELDLEKMARGYGLGIKNTKKRLALIYGELGQFEILNESKGVVLTEIIIPKSLL